MKLQQVASNVDKSKGRCAVIVHPYEVLLQRPRPDNDRDKSKGRLRDDEDLSL